jgi:hypothetical protein
MHKQCISTSTIPKFSRHTHHGWLFYQSSMCACAQRTGAAAHESLRRDRPGGLTSPALCKLAAAPVHFAHADDIHKTGRFTTPNTRHDHQQQQHTCLNSTYAPDKKVVGDIGGLLLFDGDTSERILRSTIKLVRLRSSSSIARSLRCKRAICGGAIQLHTSTQ